MIALSVTLSFMLQLRTRRQTIRNNHPRTREQGANGGNARLKCPVVLPLQVIIAILHPLTAQQCFRDGTKTA